MSAAGVRRSNAELDARILAIMDLAMPDQLHVLEDKPPGEEAWSAAMVLGHLAEFPHFFAGQLRAFLADPATPVGRTHEHPERLAAAAAARGRTLGELRAAVTAAFADLAAALDGLTDRHLAMTTTNRRYGEEPLTAFLERYVIDHKRGHAEQLARLLISAKEPR